MFSPPAITSVCEDRHSPDGRGRPPLSVGGGDQPASLRCRPSMWLIDSARRRRVIDAAFGAGCLSPAPPVGEAVRLLGTGLLRYSPSALRLDLSNPLS